MPDQGSVIARPQLFEGTDPVLDPLIDEFRENVALDARLIQQALDVEHAVGDGVAKAGTRVELVDTHNGLPWKTFSAVTTSTQGQAPSRSKDSVHKPKQCKVNAV
jgi:hypothetical protein